VKIPNTLRESGRKFTCENMYKCIKLHVYTYVYAYIENNEEIHIFLHTVNLEDTKTLINYVYIDTYLFI
jgi:hypothetical protein